MSYYNDPMGYALDRYITGNWGEDQYPNEEDLACGNRKSLGINPDGYEAFQCDCGDIHLEERET